MHLFDELDIGITLYNGSFWEELRERPDLSSLIGFELEHGAEIERSSYNQTMLARAVQGKHTVVGEHGGFCDFFVPVCMQGRVDSVLVCGPFAPQRPSGTDILERWRAITGRQGHPSDAEFSHYLAITLGTLVLDHSQVKAFRTLLECLAKLIASEGSAEQAVRTIDALHPLLTEARLVEQMWNATRMMVDERSSRIWASPHRHPRRQRLGLMRFPDRAVVGLMVSRKRDRHPVEELLVRDAFQRTCVELARKARNTIAGRVGDHGVIFLGADASRRRGSKVLELAESAVTVARRTYGLDVHLGIGSGAGPLPSEYLEALAAAELALARGQRTVSTTGGAPDAGTPGSLRFELDDDPTALPPRFDRYLESLAIRHRYQLAPVRTQLEATFEPLAEAVLGRAAMSTRSFNAFRTELQRSAFGATTVSELFTAYRHALTDLLRTRAHPVQAGHDRSLQRALDFMGQHYAEALTLRSTARVAGFAPAYFSVLFRKNVGVTFAHRLSELRVERAKQLLSRSALNLTRIAELSGLSSSHYLCRVFKRATGETPERFRNKTDRLFTVGRTVGKKIRASGELTEGHLRPKADLEI
jgi:AraC-like DNA-binding protein